MPKDVAERNALRSRGSHGARCTTEILLTDIQEVAKGWAPVSRNIVEVQLITILDQHQKFVSDRSHKHMNVLVFTPQDMVYLQRVAEASEDPASALELTPEHLYIFMRNSTMHPERSSSWNNASWHPTFQRPPTASEEEIFRDGRGSYDYMHADLFLSVVFRDVHFISVFAWNLRSIGLAAVGKTPNDKGQAFTVAVGDSNYEGKNLLKKKHVNALLEVLVRQFCMAYNYCVAAGIFIPPEGSARHIKYMDVNVIRSIVKVGAYALNVHKQGTNMCAFQAGMHVKHVLCAARSCMEVNEDNSPTNGLRARIDEMFPEGIGLDEPSCKSYRACVLAQLKRIVTDYEEPNPDFKMDYSGGDAAGGQAIRGQRTRSKTQRCN